MHKKLKIVTLIPGGRAGSTFFFSITDNHKNIIQLPGTFNFHLFWKNVKSINDNKKIAKIFYRSHKEFFDSRYGKIDRLDKLGQNKKKFFKVNFNSFLNYFTNILNINFDKYNLIESIHLAYYKAAKKKISKGSIIFLQIQDVEGLRELSELNVEVVYLIRHPLALLDSAFKNWIKYKNGKFVSLDTFIHFLNRPLNYLGKIIDYKKNNFYVIQLELLHKYKKQVLTEFCKIFNVPFRSSLYQSTFHGLEWWGDQVSQNFLRGFNSKFKNKIIRKNFFCKDIVIYEKILEKFMSKYNYKKTLKSKKKINLYFAAFLPFKIELKIIKNVFFHKNYFHLLKYPYFYFKRFSFLKSVRSYNFYPYSIGSRLIKNKILIDNLIK